ncbi:MAG TPA: hypothetical protein VLX85_06035 [Stellaceae bacterium]|nr:hypothetical protein [Stellaceae bacterium]
MAEASDDLPILSPDEIAQLFPDATPDPEPQTFELGLVLGGTASAGCYTAGVLDFLVEALDAWHLAQATSPRTTPPHHFRLEIVSGDSGGAVCATLLSRVLQFDVPHLTAASPRNTPGNPLYDLWVTGFSIEGLTGTGDLPAPPGQHLASALDSSFIDAMGDKVATFIGRDPAPGQRRYVSNPLRVTMPLANLRGVPYLTSLTGVPLSSAADGPGQGIYFVDHSDFAQFAVAQPQGRAARRGLRPDEFAVPAATSELTDPWRNYAEYAKGSAAFPGGLRTRDLHRPRAHYRYRVTVQPDQDGKAKVKALQPAWARMVDPADDGRTDYAFAVADGGSFDNAPIDLAHTWLAGMIARNPRNAKEANRAVLLVDPLAAGPTFGPAKSEGLLRTIGPFVYGEIIGSRYLTGDMALMCDESVFSRFMITPWRSVPGTPGTAVGASAITSSGLSAFAGFMHEDLRWHDYMLGRANCAAFLKNELVLDAENPLFDGWGALKNDARFRVVDPKTKAAYLPIIPLMPTLSAAMPAVPDWPKPKLATANLTTRFETRIRAVLAQAQKDELKLGWIGGAVASLVERLGADGAARSVVKEIEAYLAARNMA